MPLDRRHVLKAALTGAAWLSAPMLQAQAGLHVVVIGGGVGGVTMARLLAKAGLRVSLVEPQPAYHTCFLSNLYLGGLRDFDSLTFGYQALGGLGVQILQTTATAVDRRAKTVSLGTGEVLAYDRLVLSTGIDFVEDALPGWSPEAAQIMPHAFKSPDQTRLLRDQIDAMPQGGVFAMIAPPAPYRCPPSPYERVSMVAHRLKQTNPTAKILIFDPKDHFTKQTLFENAWGKYYNGMINWIGPDFGAEDLEIRPEAMEVVIDGETVAVDVCNAIPAQQAGRIAALAGVTDASGWAPVDAFTLQSRIDPQIYVLGDSAAAGDMPKSAFAAHGHAYAAAAALLAEAAGVARADPSYANICWSLLAPDDAVKLTESFHPTPQKFVSDSLVISAPDESPQTRHETAVEGLQWYDAITTDIFG
ncbi:FAD-dependent oxidoreductase [Cypionkella sp.]|uniref:FAD-dependent oxidoreductase n=1 Tax=Cypionkella sp. TaxID=2811411 RepID=UPI003753C60A